MGTRLYVATTYKVEYEGRGVFNNLQLEINELFCIMSKKLYENNNELPGWWWDDYNEFDFPKNNFKITKEQLDYVIENIPNLTNEELNQINLEKYDEELTKEYLLECLIQFREEADKDIDYVVFNWI